VSEDVLKVEADNFDSMRWVTAGLGNGDWAIMPNKKEDLRAAIQLLSTNINEISVYDHTGWAKHRGVNYFLHAGGAIGIQEPPPDLLVELHQKLEHFALPTPPTGAELVDAYNASLRMLDLGRTGRPGAKVLGVATALPYLTMIAPPNFTTAFVGTSGSYKTTVGLLLQQFFAPHYSREAGTTPTDWDATPADIEWLANRLSNMILLIDDFTPRPGEDGSRDQGKAQKAYKAFGNRRGKGRQTWTKHGLEPAPETPPTCGPLSTGEDTVELGSARARSMTVPFTGRRPKKCSRAPSWVECKER
jgi:hypothetical protein